MSVEEKTTIYRICDNCKKKAVADADYITGEFEAKKNWFQIVNINLWWINNKGASYNIDIDDDDDPDFCSEKCAIEWFTKQLKEVKKQENKY
jgi:hypothetical protein